MRVKKRGLEFERVKQLLSRAYERTSGYLPIISLHYEHKRSQFSLSHMMMIVISNSYNNRFFLNIEELLTRN